MPEKAREGDSSQPFPSAVLTPIQRRRLSGRGEPGGEIIISLGDNACSCRACTYEWVRAGVFETAKCLLGFSPETENKEEERQKCSFTGFQKATKTLITFNSDNNTTCWSFACVEKISIS